jgi:hypothetical protein
MKILPTLFIVIGVVPQFRAAFLVPHFRVGDGPAVLYHERIGECVGRDIFQVVAGEMPARSPNIQVGAWKLPALRIAPIEVVVLRSSCRVTFGRAVGSIPRRPFRLAAHRRVGHGHIRHAWGVGGDGRSYLPTSTASPPEASSKTSTTGAGGRHGIGLCLPDLHRDRTQYGSTKVINVVFPI